MKRRIYLMRHGETQRVVEGRWVHPDEVVLTERGKLQAKAARAVLTGIELERVIVTGLPRTLETAHLVAPEVEPEVWPELREFRSRLRSVPAEEIERVVLHALRGVIPNEQRFLGGESIGEVFDRVLPALDRLVADPDWDTMLIVAHGGINRAILSYVLTGERMFIGHIEQPPCCLNVIDVGDEWVVRATGITPLDLAHAETRQTTMEEFWEEYRSHP